LDEPSQEQLEDAIREDTLLSVRSMSGNFSELPDKAFLSYSQSFSIVKFLIETYGQAKMTALLIALQDGLTPDNALLQTYGFDTNGLEDAWRQAVGAQPRVVSAGPTVQPTPTFVPTIIPISGGSGSAVLQATTTPVPTSSTDGQSTETVPVRRGPPIALTLILMALCCTFLVLLGVIVLGFIVRSQNRKGGNHVQ
ncbi:MAG TPA: peptidase MA family metallohydrolase, partial [Anaerolineales bacterium]|nr:peptidase MA family metallohydrolase [Anaerolineales bacterium]